MSEQDGPKRRALCAHAKTTSTGIEQRHPRILHIGCIFLHFQAIGAAREKEHVGAMTHVYLRSLSHIAEDEPRVHKQTLRPVGLAEKKVYQDVGENVYLRLVCDTHRRLPMGENLTDFSESAHHLGYAAGMDSGKMMQWRIVKKTERRVQPWLGRAGRERGAGGAEDTPELRAGSRDREGGKRETPDNGGMQARVRQSRVLRQSSLLSGLASWSPALPQSGMVAGEKIAGHKTAKSNDEAGRLGN